MKKRIYCGVMDLPDWAQRVIAKEYGERKRPLCEIVAKKALDLGPGSYGSNHFFKHNNKGEVREVVGISPVDLDKERREAFFGRLGKLGVGCAVLEVVFYPAKIATLYINPEDWQAIIPEQSEMPELTDLEIKTLCITAHFIGSARKEPFGAWGIGEKVFTSLQEKKLMTKSGAITVAGLNAIENIDYNKQFDYTHPPFKLCMQYLDQLRLAEGL